MKSKYRKQHSVKPIPPIVVNVLTFPSNMEPEQHGRERHVWREASFMKPVRSFAWLFRPGVNIAPKSFGESKSKVFNAKVQSGLFLECHKICHQKCTESEEYCHQELHHRSSSNTLQGFSHSFFPKFFTKLTYCNICRGKNLFLVHFQTFWSVWASKASVVATVDSSHISSAVTRRPTTAARPSKVDR